MDQPLLSWREGTAKTAILDFVGSVTSEGSADYVAGAELALERARESGWTVVSIKDDWITVFGEGETR